MFTLCYQAAASPRQTGEWSSLFKSGDPRHAPCIISCQFRTSGCKLFKQDCGEIADPLGPSQVSSLHWAHIGPRPTLTRNPSFFSIHVLEASNGKNSRGLEGPNSRSHKSLTSPGETKHPCPSPLFHVEPARKPGTECCLCHLVAALPSVFVVCLLRPWDTMAIQSFRGVFPL